MEPIDVTLDYCGPISDDLFELLTGHAAGEPPADPVHEVQVQAELPGRLTTGRRAWPMSRAEHARRLRVGRLRRRVARRAGRPVAPVVPVLVVVRGRLRLDDDGTLHVLPVIPVTQTTTGP